MAEKEEKCEKHTQDFMKSYNGDPPYFVSSGNALRADILTVVA